MQRVKEDNMNDTSHHNANDPSPGLRARIGTFFFAEETPFGLCLSESSSVSRACW